VSENRASMSVPFNLKGGAKRPPAVPVAARLGGVVSACRHPAHIGPGSIPRPSSHFH
jgi:hypothetical protein